MNSIKRIGLVVISCIILLLACICPVSASGSPMFTKDDLLDIGFLEDSDGSLYYPSGTYNPFEYSFYLVPEKNYPDFDPNDLPWGSFPDYVLEILNIGYEYFSNLNIDPKTEEYKVPFVGVRVFGNTINVYVGYNIGLAVNSNTHRLVLYVHDNYYSGVNISGWALYRASFRRSDLSVITPWYDARSTAEPWGDTGYCYTLTDSWLTSTAAYDLYLYGANAPHRVFNVYSIAYSLLADDSSDALVIVNYPLGFQNGLFFYNPEFYQNGYAAFFKPNIYGSVDKGAIDNYYGEQEKLYEEIPNFNPDDIFGDFDTSGWSVVFNIVQNFVVDYTPLFTLISTMLTLGFIALIFGR